MLTFETDDLVHPRQLEYSSEFRAYLFGRPRLFYGDEELCLETNRKKCIHILLWFLLNPQKPCSADQFVEVLWPDVDPLRALGRFDVNVHALKRILQPGLRPHESSRFIRHHANRVYSFAGDGSWWSDIEDLELSCRRGNSYDLAGDHVRARFYYRRVGAFISRGQILSEDTDAWLDRYRRKYALMSSQALMRLLHLDLGHGVWEEVIETAYLLRAVDPGNPRALAALADVASAGRLPAAARE